MTYYPTTPLYVISIVFLCLACRRSFSLALRPMWHCATHPWHEGHKGWYIVTFTLRIRCVEQKSRNTNSGYVGNIFDVVSHFICEQSCKNNNSLSITKKKIAYMSLNMVFSLLYYVSEQKQLHLHSIYLDIIQNKETSIEHRIKHGLKGFIWKILKRIIAIKCRRMEKDRSFHSNNKWTPVQHISLHGHIWKATADAQPTECDA